jgi:hypothetical protein
VALSGNVHQLRLLKEHATGWAGLIDGLKNHLVQLDYTVEIQQVKEKWGGLRVYANVRDTDDYDDETASTYVTYVQTIIDAVEDVSFMLCYVCGGGTDHKGEGGWTRFFCGHHDTKDVGQPLEVDRG